MLNKIIALITSIITVFVSIFNFFFVPKSYEYRDIAYGTHERQVLDLNIPKENDGEIGLVLYIHGGAWLSGDKKTYHDEIENISDYLGYAAATMNYHYIDDELNINDILDDIDLALKCIKQKGEEIGVNINKVLLTGHSAGGHLSMLYGYSRTDTAPIKPVAVINNCGPADLSDRDFYFDSGLGTPDVVADLISKACGKRFTPDTIDSAKQEIMKVSPITYIDENTIPTVINHAENDNIVPYTQALVLKEKLTEYGVANVLNTYPNSGHTLDDDFISDIKADKIFVEYCKTYLN